MKTDELVTLLATQAGAVEPNAAAHRFTTALGWGLFGTALAMAVILGVRPDIDAAALLPMFWFKLAFPSAVAVTALYAALRLSRPGGRLGRVPFVLAGLTALLWLLAAATLLNAPPAQRASLVFGGTWQSCPFNIALLSLPVFAASLWAMKKLAPTRLALAGAAAGLLAGAAGAAVYALHCPEMAAPFLAVWYVLGMLIPAAAGALIGPRLLRW